MPSSPPERPRATVAPAPPRFRIATPADWVDVDLDRSGDIGPLVRLVASRSTLTPEQAAEAGDVLEMLAAANAQAVAHGAVFASVLSQVVEGAPVSASLFVAVRHEQAAGGAPAPEALARRLRHQPRSTPVAHAVEVVTLPAGKAVRSRGRTFARPVGPTGPTVEVDTVQYFVPVPDGDGLLVLTFSTPTLPLADAFAELFDAIAGSLSWEG